MFVAVVRNWGNYAEIKTNSFVSDPLVGSEELLACLLSYPDVFN